MKKLTAEEIKDFKHMIDRLNNIIYNQDPYEKDFKSIEYVFDKLETFYFFLDVKCNRSEIFFSLHHKQDMSLRYNIKRTYPVNDEYYAFCEIFDIIYEIEKSYFSIFDAKNFLETYNFCMKHDQNKIFRYFRNNENISLQDIVILAQSIFYHFYIEANKDEEINWQDCIIDYNNLLFMKGVDVKFINELLNKDDEKNDCLLSVTFDSFIDPYNLIDLSEDEMALLEMNGILSD